MTRHSLVSLAGLAVAAVVLVGCESSPKSTSQPTSAAMGMLNTECPYTGNPVSADSTAEFGGYSVGFCCNGCKNKWVAQSDAEKQAFVAKYTR